MAAINILFVVPLYIMVSTVSCSKPVHETYAVEEVKVETALDSIEVINTFDPEQVSETQELGEIVSLSQYAELSIHHQSAAVYGDYVFLVRAGRGAMYLFDMVKKTKVYLYTVKGEDPKVYHCNQSSFGIEKYASSDYFPLLYISQYAKSERRCITEVFRIIPKFSADNSTILSFKPEKVQEILFPPMSENNSMGNVNSVIDSSTGWLYTYSRNNDSSDANFGKCKVSRFAIPDIHQPKVVLEDSDINLSFCLDVEATNMQGGCIAENRLYIGQGHPSAGYVYLNVVDLAEKKLVKRYNLLASGIKWEPEGCFYYDGNVMLSYSYGISIIIEE